MTVASQIEDFRRYLIEDRRAPSNTVISYMRDLSRFSDFLVGSGIDEGNGVTPSVVSAYVDKLKNDGWSASTVSRSVAALKCFYSYLHQAGHMPANPAANASAAPPAKSLPRILTIGEMELLLKQPLSYGSKGCRDKAMLDLMYATGIRVSEFVALNIDDINLATGLVRCRDADKHKERHIPLYPSAIKSLGDYINRARPELLSSADEQALFLNMNGERITRQGVWKILKYYQDKLGIDKVITPHTLRHSFAAHLLENGADLHSLKQMLGHSDISSTQIYAQLVKKQLKDIYNKTHPKA